MPLNKFAVWGQLPPAVKAGPGIAATLRTEFGALNRLLNQRLPGPQPPPVSTPSLAALRVIWSLNAVRDALSDQGEPSAASTNRQLSERTTTATFDEVTTFLNDFHAPLLAPYEAQFRELTRGDAAFEVERCERIAELATFELVVMATVKDPPVVELAAQRKPRRSSRSR